MRYSALLLAARSASRRAAYPRAAAAESPGCDRRPSPPPEPAPSPLRTPAASLFCSTRRSQAAEMRMPMRNRSSMNRSTSIRCLHRSRSSSLCEALIRDEFLPARIRLAVIRRTLRDALAQRVQLAFTSSSDIAGPRLQRHLLQDQRAIDQPVHQLIACHWRRVSKRLKCSRSGAPPPHRSRRIRSPFTIATTLSSVTCCTPSTLEGCAEDPAPESGWLTAP